MNFIFKGFMKMLVRLYCNPKVIFENPQTTDIKLEKPTIIVCNHISHIDGTVVSYLFRKYELHHLAAKDRFEQGGFVRWYLEYSGCIPIDRKGVSTDWVHTSIKILNTDGENIAIYPEGRHGHNHEILPFHSGVTTIAALAQCPIMLVYNDGPYKLFHRTKFVVSDAFMLEAPVDGMTSDYIQKQTDFLHDRMLELQRLVRNNVEDNETDKNGN